MVAGLIGGLPAAGATMGTAINIRAGARTRASGALSAAFCWCFCSASANTSNRSRAPSSPAFS